MFNRGFGMNRSIAAGLGVIATCLALPPTGSAATNVMDFEGLQNEAIAKFYDGGLGGNGSGPGPDYGVTFQADVIAAKDLRAVANEPSPDTVAFPIGPNRFMNVPGGFADLSLFYAGALRNYTLTVYDGPDGTGNVLATVPLPENSSAGGCPLDPPFFDDALCNWDPVDVTFSGTARSVDLGGPASEHLIVFDDIAVTTPDPVTTTEQKSCHRESILLGDKCTVVFECPASASSCTLEGRVEALANKPTGIVSAEIFISQPDKSPPAQDSDFCNQWLKSSTRYCTASAGPSAIEPGHQGHVACFSNRKFLTLGIVTTVLGCHGTLTVTRPGP